MRSWTLPGLLALVVLAGCGDDDTKTVTVEKPITDPALPEQTIDIGRCIAGVAVGMSSAKVKQVLGEPDNETEVPEIFGGTNTKLAQTREGIGVGSREEEVVRGVGSVSCNGPQGTRSCAVGDPSAGGIVTDFRLAGGRVQRVVVARVID
jgi:hypothetical protein